MESLERRILAIAAATALPLCAGLALAIFFSSAHAQPVAGANGYLTEPSGKTLYTFDEDKPGKSSCYGFCAFGWPPFLAGDGAAPTGPYTLVVRDDGSRQWAIGDKPLYRYVGDLKAGDVRGDGKDGTWHVVAKGAN